MRLRLCCALLLLLVAATTQPGSDVTWRTKGITKTKPLNFSHYERDQWINVAEKDAMLQIDLPRHGYSSVLMTDRFDYSEKAALLIDVKAISKGGFTVQAVCYNDVGQAFNYVDLIENIESTGRFEVPLRIYRTPLKGTKQISFKIWVSGDHTSVTLSKLAYGTAE